MCCLFGIIDYAEKLSRRQKNHALSILSTQCEARGTDATGIAYNNGGHLCIYKRPLSAHKMHFDLPPKTSLVMGHTRMTTQGSETLNMNNHPFRGACGETHFALAHNGVLYNDHALRKQLNLSTPKIETDSYSAVQLIEQQKTLNFDSLKFMAEKVEGSFSFTVLDDCNRIHFVKGDNPLCLYHYPKTGVYLYASTEEILKKAIRKMHLLREKPVKIEMETGDILQIDEYGVMRKSSFNTDYLFRYRYSGGASFYTGAQICAFWEEQESEYAEYLDQLKAVAGNFGYSPEDIDRLQKQGFSCEEIEDAFYRMEW